MDCPICGHKMEETDSFCTNCGHYALPLQSDGRPVPVIDPPPDTPTDGSAVISPCPSIPGEPAEAPKKVAERLYPPPEPQNAPPVSTPASPPEQKKADPKGYRRLKILSVVLALAVLAALAVTVYVLYSTSTLRAQLSKAQKESLTAQSQAAELETQITELTDSLSAAREENANLSTQVADLRSQVSGLETSVNQNEYDKAAAQRDLEEAKSSLAAVQEEKTALEGQLTEAQDALTQAQTDLEAAQTENAALQAENNAYEAEAGFYDSYVVFVMLSSTDKYYHKYDCPHFTQKNFVAYSTKLAEANGYTPCPDCVG